MARPRVVSKKSTRTFYNNHQKATIVSQAYSTPKNLRPTALKYGISPSNIRRWKANLEAHAANTELSDFKKSKMLCKKTLHLGCKPFDNGHYHQLKIYFNELENMNRIISVNRLAFHMKKIDHFSDVPLSDLRQRIHRWLVSENLVQRRITHVSQNCNHDPVIISDFVQYINETIIIGQHPPSVIVNIDETNIYFDMAGKMTLARRGKKTVSLEKTGSAARATVLLGVTMNGQKLPPFIIFKGEKNGRIHKEWSTTNNFPVSCIYNVQEKGWVDEPLFLLWIQQVWKPFCAGKPSSFLLMDEFTAHMTDGCTSQISACGSQYDFIVGGYTNVLQVLDVGVNKPFKDYMRSEYEEFMVANTDNAKPKRLDIAKWIDESWKKITGTTITNTWNSIGFKSNY